MHDCLIIGGGAVGFSLAYELSKHGRSVCVVDRQTPGRESSWAGAGLLPPCLSRIGHPALDSLVEMSNRLHADWAKDLQEETGINNEYVRCGALLLATTEAIRADLEEDVRYWRDRDIRLDSIESAAIAQLEPALDRDRVVAAYLAPDEVQVRNPRHMKALIAACQQRGVDVLSDEEVIGFETHRDCVTAVNTATSRIEAAQFCICGGAWSTSLLESMGLPVSVRPIRGQIVLLSVEQQILRHIIYDGPHYLVPRADGHILVGSTVEDVGFNKSTTPDAVATLINFAHNTVPQLSAASVEQSWAGLRPATPDGLPYLDRVPEVENCFVAAGHFRCGLQLSTATAVLMRQLMAGEPPNIDLSAFSLTRDTLVVS